MAFLEIQWRPSDRQLRHFGLPLPAVLPLAGWAILGFPGPARLEAGGAGLIAFLAFAGVATAVLGLVRPAALRPLYRGTMLLTWPVGMVVQEALMGLVFFGLFMPVACLFRLIGRDALCRKMDRSAPSYWRPKSNRYPVERYFRQA